MHARRSAPRSLVPFAILSAVAFGACESTKTPASPLGATSATTAASIVSSTNAPTTTVASGDPEAAAAWDEPAVIDALAKDCAWHPKGYAAGALSEDTPRPLTCDVPWEQSCAYDPCPSDDCVSACAKSCDGCDAACTGSCEGCKKACTGADAEACRATCAQSCGACKQRCRTSRDTCASSECQKKSDACWKSAEAAWKKNHCSCKAISGCFDACGGWEVVMAPDSVDAKTKKCGEACMAKAAGCDIMICTAFGDTEPFQKP